MLWFADSSLCLVCNGNPARGAGSPLAANGSSWAVFTWLCLGLILPPSCVGMNLGRLCCLSGPAPGLPQRSRQQKRALRCVRRRSGCPPQLCVFLRREAPVTPEGWRLTVPLRPERHTHRRWAVGRSLQGPLACGARYFSENIRVAGLLQRGGCREEGWGSAGWWWPFWWMWGVEHGSWWAKAGDLYSVRQQDRSGCNIIFPQRWLGGSTGANLPSSIRGVPWLHRFPMVSPSYWWGWMSVCPPPSAFSAQHRLFPCFVILSSLFRSPHSSSGIFQECITWWPNRPGKDSVCGCLLMALGTTHQLCPRLLLAQVHWLTGVCLVTVRS